MIKTKLFTLIFGSTLLVGCGTVEIFNGVKVYCRDKSVTVHQQRGSLTASPELVKVCRGYTVTVRFVPPVTANSARTRQDAAANPEPAPWMDRDNAAGMIAITPTAGAASGEFKYSIEVDGIGLLDPRVGVIP